MQMRTTLNISDALIKELLKLSGKNNKTEVITIALKEYLRKLKRNNIKKAYGRLKFDIDIQKSPESELGE